eukprot:scaffold85975_cov62-Phaeocystis_antarctica.AAC.7
MLGLYARQLAGVTRVGHAREKRDEGGNARTGGAARECACSRELEGRKPGTHELAKKTPHAHGQYALRESTCAI